MTDTMELMRLADDGCPHAEVCDDPVAALRTRYTPERDAELALEYWGRLRPGMSNRAMSEAVRLLASRAEPLAHHVRDLLRENAELRAALKERRRDGAMRCGRCGAERAAIRFMCKGCAAAQGAA